MKLYNITYTLQMEHDHKKYEETFDINVPAISDRDARDKFLEAINLTKVYISPKGTFWPMFYTRAIITKAVELNKTNLTSTNTQTNSTDSSIIVKKERKPRSPNKKKDTPQKGIKPRGRRKTK